MKSGIYTITSPSGKIYVGSTINLAVRKNRHFNQLKKKTHHSIALQRRLAEKFYVLKRARFLDRVMRQQSGVLVRS